MREGKPSPMVEEVERRNKQQEKEEKQMSRRNFLRKTAATGAALGAATIVGKSLYEIGKLDEKDVENLEKSIPKITDEEKIQKLQGELHESPYMGYSTADDYFADHPEEQYNLEQRQEVIKHFDSFEK